MVVLYLQSCEAYSCSTMLLKQPLLLWICRTPPTALPVFGTMMFAQAALSGQFPDMQVLQGPSGEGFDVVENPAGGSHARSSCVPLGSLVTPHKEALRHLEGVAAGPG